MRRLSQMLRIKMQPISVFLAFLAVSASADFLSPTSHEYSCKPSRKPCTLQDVFLESESQLEQVTFPNIADPLIIESGKIPNFTRKLSEKLAGIVDLTINGLQLKTLYIKPEMTHLEATDNQIETLLVDANQTSVYEMVTLNLSGNNLSNVELLSRFTKLRQLTLDRNSLDQLSMDVFTGMSGIRRLSIANNRLFTVDTESSVQLPKLRSLSLAGNQLMELNVEKWELDSLMELDLSKNKLYLLRGNLGQFNALVDLNISGNYWKCEVLVEIFRLDRLRIDRDEEGHCKKEDMSDVKQVCCFYDASSILGNTAGGENWEEFRKLNEFFQQFKNATEQNLKRIGEVEKDNELTLLDRIKNLEDQQRKIWDKLNDRGKSVAVEELNELKSVISFRKSSIQALESKQTDLGSKLDDLEERVQSLRERMDEKFVVVENVNEKVAELEKKKGDEAEAVEKTVTELRNTFKQLERQQLNYHLSSVDLKSQIGSERSRISEVQDKYSKLLKETDRLRDQMGSVQKDVNIILSVLHEINSSEP